MKLTPPIPPFLTPISLQRSYGRWKHSVCPNLISYFRTRILRMYCPEGTPSALNHTFYHNKTPLCIRIAFDLLPLSFSRTREATHPRRCLHTFSFLRPIPFDQIHSFDHQSSLLHRKWCPLDGFQNKWSHYHVFFPCRRILYIWIEFQCFSLFWGAEVEVVSIFTAATHSVCPVHASYLEPTVHRIV